MCATAVSDVRIPHFIGGEWINSKVTDWQELINPATQAPLGKVPLADVAEVNAAIEATIPINVKMRVCNLVSLTHWLQE